jgi:hypothetical protein
MIGIILTGNLRQMNGLCGALQNGPAPPKAPGRMEKYHRF